MTTPSLADMMSAPLSEALECNDPLFDQQKMPLAD